MTELSLLIPVFNEEKVIDKNIQEVVGYLSEQKYSWEIIIIDDGSRDNTIEKVNKFVKDNIKLIKLKTNMGKGAALRAGVEEAQGKYIIFSDADLSVPISYTQLILMNLQEGYDVAIGSRRIEGAKIVKHQPFFRELAGRFHTFLARIFTGAKISDFTCGFKGFKNSAAKKIFSRSLINRWSYDDEILFLAKKFNYRIKEVPVSWINRSDSRVSMGSAIATSLLDLIRIKANNIKRKYDQLD